MRDGTPNHDDLVYDYMATTNHPPKDHTAGTTDDLVSIAPGGATNR